MRLHEIVEPNRDRELFARRYSHILADAVFEQSGLPIVAITDRESGKYLRVVNRISEDVFLDVDGLRSLIEIIGDHDYDDQSRVRVRQTSSGQVSVDVNGYNRTPPQDVLDAARAVAARLIQQYQIGRQN